MHRFLNIFPIFFLPTLNWFWYLFIFPLIWLFFGLQYIICSFLSNVFKDKFKKEYPKLIRNRFRFLTVYLNKNFDILLERYKWSKKSIELFWLLVNPVQLLAIINKIFAYKIIKRNVIPKPIRNSLKP